jgi:AraC-like DNA-binding protein
MIHARRIPSPPLDGYIDDLYYIDGPAPYTRLKVFPMPSLHLMVNLGQDFQVYKADQAQLFACCREGWWIGLWSSYHQVEWPVSVRLFGVHFKPDGAYPFLKIPLRELHNQIVELEALWGVESHELHEQLSETTHLSAGFDLLERFLLARLDEVPRGLPLVRHATQQIARLNGALSIRALCEQIGLSQNHLGTQFKQMIGGPPKEVACLYRFSHILRSIDPTKPVDWTRISHLAGFYDQSHLHKEFLAMTSLSPTDYLRLRLRFLAQNPEQARSSLGYLPID